MKKIIFLLALNCFLYHQTSFSQGLSGSNVEFVELTSSTSVNNSDDELDATPAQADYNVEFEIGSTSNMYVDVDGNKIVFGARNGTTLTVDEITFNFSGGTFGGIIGASFNSGASTGTNTSGVSVSFTATSVTLSGLQDTDFSQGFGLGQMGTLVFDITTVGAGCSAPSDAATSAVFGTETASSLTLSSFTAPAGGADGYAIYMNSTNSFIAPSDGDQPVVDITWNGAGQQPIYFGTSASPNVTVSGLDGNTTYFFRVYAYNDCSGTDTYETTGLNANDTTANSAPTQNANTGSSLNEGGTDIISSTELDFDDAEEADTDITYTLDNTPSNGTLRNNTTPLSVGGTFTQDDLNSNRIDYVHNGGNTTSDSFQFDVSDGQGGSVNNQTFSFTIAAVNDDPTLTGLPASITVTEDVGSNVDLSAATFADEDAATGNVSLTITAAAGTLSASSGGGVTISNSGTATITLLGTVANIDTYLNTVSNIQYTTANNSTTSTSLSFTANDGGNTGTGGGSTITVGSSVTVNITAVNDVPTVSSVSFLGNLTVGQTLTGSYAYDDQEGDAESGTTYQWYRSDDGAGTNKAAIFGATNDTYVLVNDDLAKYISFEVTPSDGSDSGGPEESALDGPIAAPPNNSPTVTSTSITSATAQSLYYYDIKALDADNDVITWTANTVPAWLTFTSGTLQTSFVGTGATPTNTGDGVNQSPDGTTASSAVIRTGTAAHGDNKLFFTDTEEYGVRYVDESGNVQTWYQGDGTYTNLNPVGIAYDVVNDAVYVGDYAKSDIVKIDHTGTRTLLSDLPEPFMLRLLVNSNGSKLYASARGGIYEIDLANNDPATNWTRVVGTGTMGYSDTGTASTSQVSQPHGMAFDSAGRLVFTDRFNDIIRRVNLATDTIETIAGTQGAGTETGDGGPAVNATFNDPSGLVINEHDEIFISERLSKRIRKIDINGDIDTFFTVSAGGFADDLVISDAGELYLVTTTLIAQVATKAELTGTPTNADAGVHDVALILSDGIANVPYNFQITVQSINMAPTDITLDNNSIGQSATGVDSTVGTLSTTDADSSDSHTYTLVSGTGDTDNSSFNISGSIVRTNSSLAVGSYSVRINTNDGTDDFAKEFTVNVTDDVAPEGYTVTIDQDPISSSNQTTISFTFAGAGIGTDYDYTFSSDGGGTNVTGSGTIATATDQITGIDLSGLGDGNITLSVTLTDTNGNEGVPATDSKTKDVVEPVPNLVIAESLYFGPFTIRLQFSEPVLDLAPNPVLIAPGPGGEQMATLGPLQEVTAGLLYDIQVTPLVPGEIVFYNDLYGMARDEAGNYTIPLGFVNSTYYDLDTDNDGIGNSTDTDDDNDGTPDQEDAFPLDENEDTDTDGDGTGDNADDDDDNDGTPDDEDAFPFDATEDTDTDGDGIGDNTDTDDDGDGYTDDEEEDQGADPKDDTSVPEDVDDIDDDTSDDTEATPALVPAQAFTPNGDGNNDTWIVPGINDYPNNVVRVYNRWGHEVFATQFYRNDWGGFYKDNRELLPAGSYLYVIDLGNGQPPLQGWIFINY